MGGRQRENAPKLGHPRSWASYFGCVEPLSAFRDGELRFMKQLSHEIGRGPLEAYESDAPYMEYENDM
jgi:hypothetical protein